MTFTNGKSLLTSYWLSSGVKLFCSLVSLPPLLFQACANSLRARNLSNEWRQFPSFDKGMSLTFLGTWSKLLGLFYNSFKLLAKISKILNLLQLSDALEYFHKYWTIFTECGVWVDGFALPRQHTLIHYVDVIHAFRAPNGLCLSITESKHIKAMKEPWHHSSCFKALGQILLTNQQMDKWLPPTSMLLGMVCWMTHA